MSENVSETYMNLSGDAVPEFVCVYALSHSTAVVALMFYYGFNCFD